MSYYAPGSAPVLAVERLVSGYGGQAVLHSVDLELFGGEVVSLLGANGAGKSTLLKTVMGTVPVMSGEISLLGRVVTDWPSHRRVAAGVGYSPEGRRVFANLTVQENLLIGATALPKGRRRDRLGAVQELFPVLADRSSQRAGTLSGGEQQMLAIARAMMTGPKLLLVEEPSQGLSPVAVDRVYVALRAIAEEAGVAVLVAEQFQQVHEDACDRILVIDKGEVIPDEEIHPDTGRADFRGRAVVIYESLTGNTRFVAETVAHRLKTQGIATIVSSVTDVGHAAIATADVVVIGGWVDGLMWVGQKPARRGRFRKWLPGLDGKPTYVFMTYAMDPGGAPEKLAAAVADHGGRVVDTMTIKRNELADGAGRLADRILAGIQASAR
jgi:ABC-type branched-subunit amino acid transport system ATPase component